MTAAAFALSPLAKKDLDCIWRYSFREWGEARAECYVREIGRVIEYLAADPARGRACDDIRDGYRKYPAGSHLIFYRLSARGIDVVRILHQRMDIDRHL